PRSVREERALVEERHRERGSGPYDRRELARGGRRVEIATGDVSDVGCGSLRATSLRASAAPRGSASRAPARPSFEWRRRGDPRTHVAFARGSRRWSQRHASVPPWPSPRGETEERVSTSPGLSPWPRPSRSWWFSRSSWRSWSWSRGP